MRMNMIDKSTVYEEMYTLFGRVGMSLKRLGLKREAYGALLVKFSALDDTLL